MTKFLLSTTLLSVLILTSCGGPDIPPEPTEVTVDVQKRMDNLRVTLKEINDKLPAEGEEVELLPTTKIKDWGFNKSDKKLNRMFTINDNYLLDLAEGGKNADDLQNGNKTTMTFANWLGLDDKPLEDNKMYTPRHDELIAQYEGMKYLGVIRKDYYVKGKLDGNTIVKKGGYGAWMFIFDVAKREMVASVYIEVENSNSIMRYQSGTGGMLWSDIHMNMEMRFNDFLDEYIGNGKQNKLIRNDDYRYEKLYDRSESDHWRSKS